MTYLKFVVIAAEGRHKAALWWHGEIRHTPANVCTGKHCAGRSQASCPHRFTYTPRHMSAKDPR